MIPHTHGGTDAPECTPFGVRCKPARKTRRSITRTLELVRGERYAQVAKWGDDSSKDHADGTGPTIPSLNAREAAQHATDYAAENGTLTWRHILEEEVCEALAESDPAKLRAELIQVAAVAVKWVEAIDRRGGAL